mmetsp:Transcript_86903/g.119735  ORF Transcript_86903/g.119735 Transcript_86903/m.119735 type:complete len:289 (+) Transcript_86903:489-1355(+)
MQPGNASRVHGPVPALQLLNHEEHKDGVTSTPHTVGREAVVQGEEALLARHLRDGLHCARVRQLKSHGIRLLRRHPVLRGLEGHRHDRVHQASRQRGRHHVRVTLDAKAAIDGLELVIRRNLRRAHQASAQHEGCAAAPECRDTLLLNDARCAVDHTRVIAALRFRQGCIVGHAHQRYLARARDVRGHAAGRSGTPQASGEVHLAVLSSSITEHLEEAVPAARIEDLSPDSSSKALVEGHEALLTDGLACERREPQLHARVLHARKVHANADGVHRMDEEPSEDASHA